MGETGEAGETGEKRPISHNGSCRVIREYVRVVFGFSISDPLA